MFRYMIKPNINGFYNFELLVLYLQLKESCKDIEKELAQLPGKTNFKYICIVAINKIITPTFQKK